MSKEKINPSELRVHLRNLRIEDYVDLTEAMSEAYSGMGGQVWSREQIAKLLKLFPEGQLALTVNGKVVGVALSLIVDYAKYGDSHTYEQITGTYRFTTHDPEGDVLYGIDLFVHPQYRGMRLARRIYDGRKELCENLNLRSIVAGGRIPNYNGHAGKLTPKQYIEQVKRKEIYDPILTFQLSNDFTVKRVLRNYLPSDHESKAYATLIEWNNIYFQEKERLFNAQPAEVRLGLVQWQMRPADSLEALIGQLEYFVDAISEYEADFLLFPELFNGPLMVKFNKMAEAQAIRALAEYTEPLRQKFVEFAISYNVNIISGSMPMIEDGKLYNVSFLCRRNGTWESYRKIHITPSEEFYWGMSGGDQLKIFDTDCGRIGILICYDVEFPELSRLYADQGVQILFVPFLTDTQNGYNRVRTCAQARAIENECYVAIAGCVGNLPRVKNMGVQFAQSAVFSPSDFAFPANSIVAEATPNTEMTVVADINLDLLKELHLKGSVNILKDRRKDLYQLKWIGDSPKKFPENDSPGL